MEKERLKLNRSSTFVIVLAVVLVFSMISPYFMSNEQVYAATSSSKDFWDYFKLEKNPVDQLKKHENDKYYLTTPYHIGSTPNGTDGKGGKMNCTGFIHAIVRDCGGTWPNIEKPNSGVQLFNAMMKAKVKCKKFSSIEQARKSGYLKKGAIIWYGPKVYKYNSNGTVKSTVPASQADNHWVVYWGNGTSNLQWESSPPKNHKGPMKGKTSKVYVFVFNPPEPGKLKIVKKMTPSDAKTSGGYSLNGVKFGVYKSDKKTLVKTLTTNSSGTCSTSLDVGTYYVKETSVGSTNLKLDTSWHKVNVKESATVTYTATDPVEYASLKIQKKIQKGDPSKTYPLSGYKFTIVNTKNQKTYTATTNASGIADFGQILAGTYKVSEIITDNMKELDIESVTTSQNVTLMPETPKTVTWTNKTPPPPPHNVPYAHLKIFKETDDGSDVAGFKFKIDRLVHNNEAATAESIAKACTKIDYNKKMYTLGEWQIEKESLEKINNAAKEGKTGTYELTLKNTLTPKNTGEKPLNISFDVTVDLTQKDVKDTASKDDLTVTSSGSSISGRAVDMYGIDYYSYSVNKHITWQGSAAIESWEKVTDETGMIIMRNVKEGLYTVTEILEGSQIRKYVQPESQSQEITKQTPEKTYKFNFTNHSTARPVSLVKTSEDGEIEGIEFTLTGTDPDGNDIEIVKTTDKDGKIDFGKLYSGTYTVEETGFDGDKYSNEYKVEGHTVPTQTVTIPEDPDKDVYEVKFHNTLRSYLLVTKIDNDTNLYLPGAEFELREVSSDGTKETVANFTVENNDEGYTVAKILSAKEGITGCGLQDVNITVDDKNALILKEKEPEPEKEITEEDLPEAVVLSEDLTSEEKQVIEEETEDVETAESESESWKYGVILGLDRNKTYEIEEVKAPEGYEKIQTPMELKFENNILQIAVPNNMPSIYTTASADDTDDHITYADDDIVITDSVQFTNLVPGHTYTMKGKMMLRQVVKASEEEQAESEENLDEVIEEELNDDNGELVESEPVTFVAESEEGSIDVRFTFKGKNAAGSRAVIYEYLYDSQYDLIAEHDDIYNEDQTVYIPEIGTTAADWFTKDHQSRASDRTRFVDEVRYEKLMKDKQYTAVGTLMEKSTGKPVLDEYGMPVTAQKTFVAEDEEGTVDVTFTFDSLKYANRELVVFEKLYYGTSDDGKVVATHEDINDEGQTIKMSDVGYFDVNDKNNFSLSRMFNPKTGEGAVMWFLIILIAVAGTGIGYTLRKENDEDERLD